MYTVKDLGQTVYLSHRDHGFKVAEKGRLYGFDPSENTVWVWLDGYGHSLTFVNGKSKSEATGYVTYLLTEDQAQAWEDGTLDLVEYEED